MSVVAYALVGMPACSQDSSVILVDDYLSNCTRGDDTPCIQAAIDAASPGDIVKFSARRYVIVPGHQEGDPRYGVIYKSGITISGEGKGKTIITTQENLKRFNRNGEIWFFNAPEGVSNVIFEDMTFDFNGAANLIDKVQINNPAIGAANKSSDITVQRVEFIGNPGNQTVFINYDNSVGERIKVVDCSFIDMGYGLPGNDRNRDHSSIYITGNNAYVSRNYFNNSRSGNITAIEIHGENALIAANVQIVGGGLVILAATHSDVSGVVSDNIALQSYGVVLWPVPGKYRISDVFIHGNNLTCYKRSCVYIRPPQPLSGNSVGRVFVTKNIFREKSGFLTGNMLGVYVPVPVERMTIANNTFVGTKGFGIKVIGANGVEERALMKAVYVVDNRFEDEYGREWLRPVIEISGQ